MANANDAVSNDDGGTNIGEQSSDSSPGDGGIANSGIGGAIDPASEVKRKRGRPPGSGKRSANIEPGNASAGIDAGKKPIKKTELDVGSLATQLEGVHKMAAIFLKNPTIEISTDESKKLAQALQNLAKQYSITVNPAVMAWVQLIGVSGAIYGPRIAVNIMVREQMKQKRKAEVSLQTAGQTANTMTVDPASGGGTMKFN
jgi:hypothetical protein